MASAKKLARFEEAVRRSGGNGNCWWERERLYGKLVERYGQKAVIRHQHQIKGVLQRAEERASSGRK